MGDALDKVFKFVFGGAYETHEPLEEDAYPRDAKGRLDRSRFTKPLAHYVASFDEYLVSLGPQGRILRDPVSRNGDVHWAVVEAVGTFARRRFELSEEGWRAADSWLRNQGA